MEGRWPVKVGAQLQVLVDIVWPKCISADAGGNESSMGGPHGLHRHAVLIYIPIDFHIEGLKHKK